MAVSVNISVGGSGRGVVGKGRIRLLRLIDETGSLRKAAMAMGMSYRNAWGIIRHIEDQLDIKVASSSRGGAEGGRTALTDEARFMIDEYDKAKERIEKALSGILIRAEVVLVIHDGNNSYLCSDGRLPRDNITEQRPVPAVISGLILALGLEPDRIRGPKVLPDKGSGGLKLVFQLDPEGIPSGIWIPFQDLCEDDREAVLQFLDPSAEL